MQTTQATSHPIERECAGAGSRSHNIAVRLADEGIPIGAICRAMQMPQGETRSVLRSALDRGQLVNIPRDDWPVGTRREERQPDTVPATIAAEDLVMAVLRTFHTTPAQSILLMALLRRPQMTKNSLHTCIQRPDKTEPSDSKIVDVMICLMRKKLKAFQINIVTIWGRGYYIPADSKMRAVEHMRANLPASTIPNTLIEDPLDDIESPSIVPA